MLMKMDKAGIERIRKILKLFNGKKILVIGDIMVDTYMWGTVSRISPEAPVPIVNINKESYTLGGAANVVNNIYSLGGSVYLVGIVGNDEVAKRVFLELEKRDIKTEGVFVDPDRPTTLKTRIIAQSQQVVRLDREKKENIGDFTCKKIFDYLDKVVKKMDAIVISDYAKGVVIPPLIEKLILLGKKHKKPILVDPQINHFHTYRGVSCLTPNHHEAGFAAGIPIVSEETLIWTGKKLLNQLKCQALLITQGEDGMTLFEKNGKISRIPTMAREVFDVTGAGDTVISAFSLAIASGASFSDAAYIGNIAAGIVVGKVGTATVNINEILHEIKVENI